MKEIYRPEIDGLRAISVLLIILYHAQLTILGYQPFKNGFIGIDIFFVISGYLITRILLKELIKTDNLLFINFYLKRIRRIIPALLFVILLSLPFAYILLLPTSFIDFSKSVISALTFSSNFYFFYSGQEYGAEDGVLKPFLHTWSLSVEEQYYILFPIFLYIIFKYFRKYILIILIVVFTASILIADFGSKNYISATFYFLHTRIYELIAGSLVFLLEIKFNYINKNKILNLILSTVGLFLIIYSLFFFRLQMLIPSFYKLLPITGACLIIYFSDKDNLITKLLSLKPLVGIGLLSYSLYLWHYPIFSFYRITNFSEGSFINVILIGIVIFLLSIFTYFFIEKPCRNKKNNSRLIIFLIFLIFFLLIIINLITIHKKGYEERIPVILKSLNEKPWTLLKSGDETCHDNKKFCRFNLSSNKNIYIIGDSQMGSIMFDLKDKVITKDYQFVTSTFGGCFYFLGFNLINTITSNIDENCHNNYFELLDKELKRNQNSIIIFGGRLPLYLSNYFFDNKEGKVERRAAKWNHEYISNGKFNNIYDSFVNSTKELSKNNKIILIYPIPEFGGVLQKEIFFNRYKKEKIISTSYKVYKERTKSSFLLLDSINGENVYRVYPHKLFCNTLIKGRCIAHNNEAIFFYDESHPSIKGSEMINDLILKEIEKIELKSK